MDYRLLFPNDYIAAHDLRGKDVTKTIKSVTVEKLRMTGGRVERKPVVMFSDTPKKLVLNKTNAKVVAGHHGTDTDKWVGKKITLYPTTTLFGKETVDCVRVREKSASRTSHVPESASPDEDPFDIDSSEAADGEPPANVSLVGDDREPGVEG